MGVYTFDFTINSDFFFLLGFFRITHMSSTKPKEIFWQFEKGKICLGLSGKILSKYTIETVSCIVVIVGEWLSSDINYSIIILVEKATITFSK